jgi:hypothetical protein
MEDVDGDGRCQVSTIWAEDQGETGVHGGEAVEWWPSREGELVKGGGCRVECAMNEGNGWLRCGCKF